MVYAANDFTGHAPPALPINPSWSPVGAYGGYYKGAHAPPPAPAAAREALSCGHSPFQTPISQLSQAMQRTYADAVRWLKGEGPQQGGLTCGCFAF